MALPYYEESSKKIIYPTEEGLKEYRSKINKNAANAKNAADCCNAGCDIFGGLKSYDKFYLSNLARDLSIKFLGSCSFNEDDDSKKECTVVLFSKNNNSNGTKFCNCLEGHSYDEWKTMLDKEKAQNLKKILNDLEKLTEDKLHL